MSVQWNIICSFNYESMIINFDKKRGTENDKILSLEYVIIILYFDFSEEEDGEGEEEEDEEDA